MMKFQVFHGVVGLLMMCRIIVCPFPPSHPYSFLNPVIDPWWSQLDQDTQKDIYNLWEKHEPSLFALSKTINLLKRNVVHSGSVITAFVDYLVAKGVDFKDTVLDDNQPEAEGRYKTYSDEKWENFAAMVQYAKFLDLQLKKSKVNLVEETIQKKINAVKKAAKAKLRLVQDATRSKIEAVRDAADSVQNSFNSLL